MPYIVRYQKVIDEHTTHRLRPPLDADGESQATELCTLDDGYTYVAVEDGAELPAQPAELTIEQVELTAALRETIKQNSPHTALIQQRMQQQIRARYSLDDELYLARIGVGQNRGTYTTTAEEDALLDDYQAYVEGVRDWGRGERAKLGL